MLPGRKRAKNEYIRSVPRASCIFASYDADRHRALTCRISCEAFPRQTGWLLSRCTFHALIGSTGHEFAAKVRGGGPTVRIRFGGERCVRTEEPAAGETIQGSPHAGI